jgi:hypothetical protein
MNNILKFILIFLAILYSSILFSQIPNYFPTQNLTAWYPFNGNSDDESGNGNNGNNFGATLTSDRFGVDNSAYYFDGNNSFINCGISEQLSVIQGSELTVSVWTFVSNQLPQDYARVIFGKAKYLDPLLTNFYAGVYGNGGFNSYIVRLTDGVPLAETLDVGEQNFYNQWVNYVFVFKGGTSNSKLFRNGQLIGANSQEYNQVHTTTQFRIGGFETGNQSPPIFFLGKIDDVGVWNRELSSIEISSLYSSSILGVSQSEKIKIKLFPNPTSSILNIETQEKIIKIKIIDITGRTTNISNFSNNKIDVSSLSNGMYFVEIKTENGLFEEKFIKN